jgi:hypothetical protein
MRGFKDGMIAAALVTFVLALLMGASHIISILKDVMQ